MRQLVLALACWLLTLAGYYVLATQDTPYIGVETLRTLGIKFAVVD